MWINKFIGILIALNQKPPKDITEGILFDDSEELIIKFHHPVGSESSAGIHLLKERDELTVHIDRIMCP